MAFFSSIIISGCCFALHSIVCGLEPIHRYHREEGKGDMISRVCRRNFLRAGVFVALERLALILILPWQVTN